MTSIYIVQCLCPLRHCVVAFVYEAEAPDDEVTEALKAKVREMLAAKQINPWCNLCLSRDWHYETGKTRFRTMQEAEGPLRESAHHQALTQQYWKASRN